MEPFFTIVLTLKGFSPLFYQTIKSIMSQERKDFELIIVEEGLKPYENEYIKKNFGGAILLTEEGKTVSEKLNSALAIATGKYIYFMFSGDMYLSPHSLGFVADLIIKEREPDIVFGAFVSREGKYPEVVKRNFSFDFLRKGKIPASLNACIFSKKIFTGLKGFDTRYRFREGFDLFCRVFKDKKKYRVSFCPVVLVDSIVQKRGVNEALSYSSETFWVLYRNFGLWRTIFWWFMKERFKLYFLWLKRAFNKAF